MDIERLDHEDLAGVAELAALMEACRVVDTPFLHPDTVDMVAADLRWGYDQSPSEHHLLRENGEVVGAVGIYTFVWDNLDLAWLSGQVHPDHRKAGAGSALLEHAFGRCRELGRPNVGADAWDGSAGVEFLEHRGFEKKSQAILRRQQVDELEPGLVEGMHAHALLKASDYELLFFEGPLPDEIISDYAEMAASINDAPLDDLQIEDDVYNAERGRLAEAAQEGRNRDHLRIAARHRDTGELAGHTQVVVERWQPSVAHQLDTAVAPAHRGHRLGLLLKAAMVLWLRERNPDVRTVDTWNAESNGYMIQVNEQLGYQVLARELQYQTRLP